MKKILLTLILLFYALAKTSAVLAFEYDVRPLAMRAVLEKYNSPMVGYENELIKVAEKYGLDWTLLAAIAGTESSFGKRMPANCLNPYGWGIYGDNKLCFNSFPDAAEAVAKGLSSRYNISSLESIGRTYNKVSTEGWINHTKFFMNKIKNASIPVAQLPIEL
ncbi:MAG: hypothetical protein E6Q53_01550 [Candidatus Moraniibacteriota bacterium]|nr:MAG: hypothetical protein E6Q53_01550 [Candidatus Moranbacteria bacterium]